MAKRSDYQISYDELKRVFYFVLAKMCHQPYITQDFTLGNLGLDNELMFCMELEFAMKKYLNRYFRNGFDFRQWFYDWNEKTSVREMLNKLAWQYDVAVPEMGFLERYRATRAAIDNKIVAQNKR